MPVLARICADMRGCFRGFFFGSIISCRACLARDAVHRHIVATNSAGPDVSCVKCCHFNGLQAHIGSIRRLSGCDPGAIAVIPAKSLSSPVPESRLRDSGTGQDRFKAIDPAHDVWQARCRARAPLRHLNDRGAGDRLRDVAWSRHRRFESPGCRRAQRSMMTEKRQ